MHLQMTIWVWRIRALPVHGKILRGGFFYIHMLISEYLIHHTIHFWLKRVELFFFAVTKWLGLYKSDIGIIWPERRRKLFWLLLNFITTKMSDDDGLYTWHVKKITEFFIGNLYLQDKRWEFSFCYKILNYCSNAYY